LLTANPKEVREMIKRVDFKLYALISVVIGLSIATTIIIIIAIKEWILFLGNGQANTLFLGITTFFSLILAPVTAIHTKELYEEFRSEYKNL
jgi:hypothetical protein